MTAASNRRTTALLALAAVGALAVPAVATAGPDGTTTVDRTSRERGPRGEIPVAGVTAEDVATLAAATGMTLAESRFILFEGSGIVADFNAAHRANPDFGGVRVLQDGELRIQVRVTDERSDLAERLGDELGRPVERLVGGRSAAQLDADVAHAADVMSERSLGSAEPVPYRITTDFESGRAVVLTPPASRSLVESYGFSSAVRVRADSTVVFEQSASFAGTARNPTCTIGFALQNTGGTHALMTSGHCTDSGSLTAYGFSLGNAQHESCAITDSQIHTTAATQIWEGFYNNSEQWTIIHAVAGGWYPGQNFFRRGKFTKATGTISDIETASVGAGGDCGVRNVTGFVLTNSTGSRIQGGDSGGPMFLAYFGNWYLGGIASTTGPSGSGGRVAWRTIPAGWTACTSSLDC